MSLYGNGPSPYDVGFSGWGNDTPPAPPGSTTWSLPGGNYGGNSPVSGNYSGSFGGGFWTGVGGLLNTGLDIWDRLDNADGIPQPVAAPAQQYQAGFNPMMMVMIGGALLLAFVLMKK